MVLVAWRRFFGCVKEVLVVWRRFWLCRGGFGCVKKVLAREGFEQI